MLTGASAKLDETNCAMAGPSTRVILVLLLPLFCLTNADLGRLT